jgi:hypothetical protein
MKKELIWIQTINYDAVPLNMTDRADKSISEMDHVRGQKRRSDSAQLEVGETF